MSAIGNMLSDSLLTKRVRCFTPPTYKILYACHQLQSQIKLYGPCSLNAICYRFRTTCRMNEMSSTSQWLLSTKSHNNLKAAYAALKANALLSAHHLMSTSFTVWGVNGFLFSLPNPAARSASSIVYAGSFRALHRRLCTLLFQCVFKA